MRKDYDFSGWATKSNIPCSDGRTIQSGAFSNCDGQTVPLVWMHGHDTPSNVLGHALLENRNEGVYAYCSFNNTREAKKAKEAVRHGDVNSLSIYANHLKHNGSYVVHGKINEVSLVLAGANPGALIDSVLLHGDDVDDEAFIYTGESLELYHSDEEEDDMSKMDLDDAIDLFNDMTEEQKQAVQMLVDDMYDDGDEEYEDEYEDEYEEDDDDDDDEEYEEDSVSHADMDIDDALAIFNDFDETQKQVVYSLIGLAVENYSDEENDMKHNVFEGDNEANSLSHADMERIINDAKRNGSLKQAVMDFGAEFIAHADTTQSYGIRDIDYLFPEVRNLNTPPEFIKRDTGWVSVVMAGVHKTPFSRIRSTFADITEDEARALGYIKGNRKKEEVFGLLKRSTTPQTIYKKQKLDRDDIIDITDFDVVAWLRSEMRVMLDEEIARALLFGDGRPVSSDDKISHEHVRPAWLDDELYTIHKTVPAGKDSNDAARQFIRTVVKARKDYKGSGNPIMFTTEDQLTDLMLMEDNNGRMIYESEDKLRSVLRVSRIVTVPVMENQKREESGKTFELKALILNLNDYNVGADKGGQVSMFDDFDIDFNQQKYLIETRCSGALIKPYSCMAIESEVTTASGTPGQGGSEAVG